MKKIHLILEKLFRSGIYPEYSDPNFGSCIKWDCLPEGVDPSSGFLNTDRAKRKRWQIDNFIFLAREFLDDNMTVVDFCSGSGHLSLPIAYLYPNCRFILVERNPVPVAIGKKRIKDSGLSNVELFNGYIQDFDMKFDLGIALHACGEATDLVQIRCLENDAAYILCPCDIGYIQNSSLKYPRSSFFSNILTIDEYKTIASNADNTCWNFSSENGKLGKLCMGYISLDRNLAAEESGYETYLFTTSPRESTPKNDIILGHAKSDRKLQIFSKTRLYYHNIIKCGTNHRSDPEESMRKSIMRMIN